MLKARSGKIIGTSKVAELLDVHPQTVRRKVRDGTLPSPFRKPGSNHLAWFQADILRIIREVSEAA
jgi:predicted DNA-binding transcriptional regulator AlpA